MFNQPWSACPRSPERRGIILACGIALDMAALAAEAVAAFAAVAIIDCDSVIMAVVSVCTVVLS